MICFSTQRSRSQRFQRSKYGRKSFITPTVTVVAGSKYTNAHDPRKWYRVVESAQMDGTSWLSKALLGWLTQ